MAIIFQRVNSQFIGAILLLDIFATIGPDSITYAMFGFVGSIIGSLVRLIRRDEADIDDKIKFFYLKDLFKIFVWALVGGFFPLVFAANGWYPWLAVICSPFTPKFWDTMETFVPEILSNLLEKFTGNKDNKKEIPILPKNETETKN